MNLRCISPSFVTKFLLRAACIAPVFLFSGCLDDNMNDYVPAEIAYVSIYHASPDAGNLDIMVDNGLAINNGPFSYQDFTGYLSFYTGDRALHFAVADDPDSVLLDTTITFRKNKYYSVFVADSLSSIETLILRDSAGIADDGKAMVRFVHLSPDAPTVDVLANDEEWFAERSFKGGTAFREVSAGTFNVDFRASEGEKQILLSRTGIELKARNYYTLLLTGFLTPPEGNTNEISSVVIKN